MTNRVKRRPICHVVAGPNGAGKSTFALEYLPSYAGPIKYVNPDLLAHGLSPTDISLSALKAGKLTLQRIAALIEEEVAFGFETTLSGTGHLKLLAGAQERGYRIHLYYLWMPSVVMLPSRIRHRVLSGGHDVPTEDVLRRYGRSKENVKKYARLADQLFVFDASTQTQTLLYSRKGEAGLFSSEKVFAPAKVKQMRKELGI